MAPDAVFMRRLMRRRNYLVGGLFGVVAVAATLLASGGGTAATANTTAAGPAYSALASTAPSGLPIVTSHHAREAGEPIGPTLSAQPPEPGDQNRPVVSTVRRLDISASGMSAWIARSAAGGICLLFYDGVSVEGVSPLDVSCSAPGGLERGTSLELSEIPGQGSEVIAAGVVPDGVSAVSEQMADGSTSTVPVVGNAWVRVTQQPAATGQEPTPITGG